MDANKTYHSTLILKDGLKESINSTLNPTEQYENEPFYYISKDLKFILNQIYRLKLRNVVNLYARMHLSNSGIPMRKKIIYLLPKSVLAALTVSGLLSIIPEVDIKQHKFLNTQRSLKNAGNGTSEPPKIEVKFLDRACSSCTFGP